MSAVPGLRYEPDYLDGAEQAALLDWVDRQPWSHALRRRVQHHGWRYDYRSRRVRPEDRIGALPPALARIAAGLVGPGSFDRQPDQAIVNEYEPGQGIAAHVDCEPCFGPVIASVSLGTPCVMELRRQAPDARVPIDLAAGSLLVLSGEARHLWTHAIPARRGDTVPGGRRARGRRVSVTFRTVESAGAT